MLPKNSRLGFYDAQKIDMIILRNQKNGIGFLRSQKKYGLDFYESKKREEIFTVLKNRNWNLTIPKQIRDWVFANPKISGLDLYESEKNRD